MRTVFTVYGKPMGKQRPRVTRYGTFTPPETRAMERAIQATYRLSGGRMMDGYVCVNVQAYYPIPKSTSKVARLRMEKRIVRPGVKRDIDNVVKLVMDALNGVAYKDDSSVVMLGAAKYYSEDPCVVVEVKTVDVEV